VERATELVSGWAMKQIFIWLKKNISFGASLKQIFYLKSILLFFSFSFPFLLPPFLYLIMDHTFASSLAGYLSILCWLIVFTP
jgi:hypothetical protein